MLKKYEEFSIKYYKLITYSDKEEFTHDRKSVKFTEVEVDKLQELFSHFDEFTDGLTNSNSIYYVYIMIYKKIRNKILKPTIVESSIDINIIKMEDEYYILDYYSINDEEEEEKEIYLCDQFDSLEEIINIKIDSINNLI